MLIFNPGAAKTEIIRLRVPRVRVRILDERQKELPCDVICDRNDLDDCEAYFIAGLKEFNFQEFFISHDAEGDIIDRKIIAIGATLPLSQESYLKVNSMRSCFKKF